MRPLSNQSLDSPTKGGVAHLVPSTALGARQDVAPPARRSPEPGRAYEARGAPRGWTLIELVVASIGLLVLGAVLMVIYQTEFRAFEVLTAKSSATAYLRSALEQIGRDAQTAQFASVPLAPPLTTLTLTGANLEGGGPVTYRCAAGAASCTVGSPSNLERVVGANVRTIAQDVIDLGFGATPNPNGKWITVRLRLQRKLRGLQYYWSDPVTDLFILRGKS